MKGEPPEGAGTGTILLAFLAGAAVGAVAALLLAPRPGAETRERLEEAVGEQAGRARRARDAARAAAAAARQAFAEAMRDAGTPAP
jgi:gas vesicle protein